MTLSTRVLTYFLVTLGLALIAYSMVFFSVARRHIDYQFDYELRGQLHSLVAAAEVEETEVKWQPLEHSVSLGPVNEFDEIHWVIVGDNHRIVEKSARAPDEYLRTASKIVTNTTSAGEENSTVVNSDLFYYQQLSAPNPQAIDREPDEFDKLTVVVGRSTTKRDLILRKLAVLVSALPLAAWLIVAISGRWIVRQALRPLHSIADQTRSISGNDFQSRLAVHETQDEIQDLGLTINRLLERQQLAFEQQRSFAANAAHELRSPVTVMLGQIDVTLRRVRSVSEYQSTLELLRIKSLAFQEIIESLLFLARGEGESELPCLHPLSLASWIDQHFKTWDHDSRAKDLQLNNNVDTATTIRLTATLLGRIMDNLISNAIKYSLPNTPIRIEASNEDSHAIIRVIDTGYGISSEDLPHIFEPFYRSAHARSVGVAGTGLGLAIANRIALAVGGNLTVTSSPGSGTSFTLTLPLSRATR